MIEKKTVSQCISSDYCKGWNDATEVVSYLGECIQLEKKRRIAAERTARQCIENYRPITHGRWVIRGMHHFCSACGEQYDQHSDNFCAECGAKMDEEVQHD